MAADADEEDSIEEKSSDGDSDEDASEVDSSFWKLSHPVRRTKKQNCSPSSKESKKSGKQKQRKRHLFFPRLQKCIPGRRAIEEGEGTRGGGHAHRKSFAQYFSSFFQHETTVIVSCVPRRHGFCRWDEDVIFKNQSRGEPKAVKRFINDTVRSDFHQKFLQRYIR